MKRIIPILMVLLLMAAGMTGCLKTEASQISAGAGDVTLEKAIAQSVDPAPEKYRAPGHWTEALEQDGLTVDVDADVVVPDVDRFPTAVVTGTTISQKAADRIRKALIGDATLYDHRPPEPYTKAEIRQAIADEKTYLTDPNSNYNTIFKKGSKEAEEYAANCERVIKDLEDQLATAPENIEIKKADTKFHTEPSPFNKPSPDGKGVFPPAIRGTATLADGRNADLAIQNDGWASCFIGDRIASRKEVESKRGNPERYGAPVTPAGITQEQAREKAESLLKDMGFDCMEVQRVEEQYIVERGEGGLPDTGVIDLRPCYYFLFTRSIDGISGNYAFAHNNSFPKENAPVSSGPRNELIQIIVAKEGLLEFWCEPFVKINEETKRNVGLLKFEDIQDIFRKQVFMDNYTTTTEITAQTYGQAYSDKKIMIHEARLGMMVVGKQGNAGEGVMIPVWDFYGYDSVRMKDPEAAIKAQFDVNENGEYIEDGPYTSYLTINAIDGSIIDRLTGY